MVAVETTVLQNERYCTFVPTSGASTMSDKEGELPEEWRQKYETAGSGWEVWRWPEFQALLRRLNVAADRPTTSLTIKVELRGLVTVTHEYRGQDITRPKGE